MLLERLIEAVAPETVLQAKAGVRVSGLSHDSRLVKSGHLFAALPGVKTNGAQYAREAAERGAAAVLTEEHRPLTALPQLVVANAREALTRAAQTWHGYPDRALRMGAITGTNGKSTTAFLVRHILRSTGTPCGLLGTLEYDAGDQVTPAAMTTPDAPELFAQLRAMTDSGCTACIMEVSSHSLCQKRLSGIRFAAAGFTNLTRDHLDYHRTMEEYREAKAILFRELPPEAVAVLNLEDSAARYYARITPARQVLGFRLRSRGPADLRARILRMDTRGTRFAVESPWGSRTLRWKLLGEHNVQNALAALCLALVLGDSNKHTFSFDRALSALENFPGVPGRLEPVGQDLAPFRVLVDYAHTDDALRNVIRALRDLKPSRVIVVFGCGGDRDRTKRPLMGEAVEELADLGIVTSDNPRSEDPRAIIAEICAGIRNHGKFIVEPDRVKAIELGISEARAGDVLLIAGKGHETYQIVGTGKHHFDDREQARAALERRFRTAPVLAGAGVG